MSEENSGRGGKLIKIQDARRVAKNFKGLKKNGEISFIEKNPNLVTRENSGSISPCDIQGEKSG